MALLLFAAIRNPRIPHAGSKSQNEGGMRKRKGRREAIFGRARAPGMGACEIKKQMIKS